MKMMYTLFFVLISVVFCHAQISIFGTNASPADKTTITNTTAVTTRWIKLSNANRLNGQGSLFVAGDLTSGSHSEGMKVEMQTACGRTSDGDTLAGDWQTIETVATGYVGLTFGAGAVLAGRQLSLSNLATTWNKFYMVRFRFSFATSTHTTDVIGLLTIN